MESGRTNNSLYVESAVRPSENLLTEDSEAYAADQGSSEPIPPAASTVGPTQGSERLYDRNFLLAFASQSIFVITNTLLAHYARWIEFLGGDLTQVGWIMGVGAFAGLLFRPWLAQLINRLGARPTWMVGYLVFSVAALGNFMLYDVGPLIYLSRSFSVLGAAIVFSSSLTYISQVAPESRRTEAIGILGVGGFVGMLIGPLLGDLLLGDRERVDFLVMFAVAGLANILPALMLMLVKSPAQQGQRESLGIRQFFVRVREYWPGSILLIVFAFGWCMTVPFGFLASYIDELPLELAAFSEIGFFFCCYAGAGILFRLSMRTLPDRIGPRRVLLLGTLINALGMLGFLLVTPSQPFLIVLPALLTGLGHGMMFHTMSSLTLAPFPKSLRGTGSALTLMTLDLGMFLGAPVLGLVGDTFGYRFLFLTLTMLLAVSGCLFYVIDCRGLRGNVR